MSGRTVLRITCGEAQGKTESSQLRENLPSWVTQAVVENRVTSQFAKISFFLQPHPNSGLKAPKSSSCKLLATDMLTISKVIEHVNERILSTTTTSTNESDQTSTCASLNEKNVEGDGNSIKETKFDQTSSQVKENKVELYCNDELLDPEWNLRTVKQLIWKNSADLIFLYLLRS